ncbi:MAG: hypothetical protein R3232_12635, partial [Clostridia bacterium]|nr:hypothetical protein [Clostridia bacterium]
IKLLAAVLAVVLVIGTVTYIYSGNFVFQSVTAGVNFIMGANDDADGSYSQYAFRQGRLAVIEDAENKTYVEKDSIWTSRAIDWIMNNPGKYIALIPAKLFYMYSVDTYAFSTFYNNKVRTSGSEYIKPLASNVLNLNFKELTWVDYVVILNQIIYMALLVMMLVSFIYLLVKKKNTREVVFVLAILVLGTGMTIITVGGARYHYPYLPIFFIMSAAFIYNLRSSRVSRKNPKRS